jgi:hypothetical protein
LGERDLSLTSQWKKMIDSTRLKSNVGAEFHINEGVDILNPRFLVLFLHPSRKMYASPQMTEIKLVGKGQAHDPHRRSGR